MQASAKGLMAKVTPKVGGATRVLKMWGSPWADPKYPGTPPATATAKASIWSAQIVLWNGP